MKWDMSTDIREFTDTNNKGIEQQAQQYSIQWAELQYKMAV